MNGLQFDFHKAKKSLRTWTSMPLTLHHWIRAGFKHVKFCMWQLAQGCFKHSLVTIRYAYKLQSSVKRFMFVAEFPCIVLINILRELAIQHPTRKFAVLHPKVYFTVISLKWKVTWYRISLTRHSLLLQYLRNNITNIVNNIFHLKTVQALGGHDLTSLDFCV